LSSNDARALNRSVFFPLFSSSADPLLPLPKAEVYVMLRTMRGSNLRLSPQQQVESKEYAQEQQQMMAQMKSQQMPPPQQQKGAGGQ
jgi:hypothetical protein